MNRYVIMAVDVLLVPMSSGNRLRIVGFLQALRRLDWRIGLVTVRDSAPLDRLRALVDEVSFVPARRFSGGALTSFDAQPFRAAVSALAAKRQPALAIAQYAWLGPALAELDPAVERWIDCHDLLHERTTRFAAAGLDSWVQCSWPEERERLAFADTLICCQERDRDRLAALLPDKRVVSIMTPVDVAAGFVRRPGTGSTVLTVGALHDGNLAVPDFASGAWDRVTARVPGARLRVVGGISATVAPRPSVDVLGTVARLDGHYADAAVVVCPVSTGSGVKTKMLEALRYGKAVVTTEIGAEGMPACVPPAWVTSQSLDDCADAVADLLIDAPKRAALEDAAFAFAARTVSGAAFTEQIDRLLPGPQPPMVALRPQEPSVSVVVTQVRSWRDLRDCLRSLCEQTYPPFQVDIIVVVQTYVPALWTAVSREFSQVALVCTSFADPARQRRIGAARARGEFVAFIESDCRADTDWLQHAVALCERYDRRAIVAEDVRVAVPAETNGFGWYDALIVHERQPGEAFVAERRWWLEHASSGAGPLAAEADVVCMAAGRVARRAATGPRTLAERASGALIPEPRRRLRTLFAALTDPRVPRRARPAMALAALRLPGRIPAPADEVRSDMRTDVVDDGRRPCDSVSVIIPSLGVTAALRECVRSVKEQTLDVPLEIIVAINAPPPAQRDDADWPGVRVVYEPAAGPAAARNAGVAASGGDVIAFIDADCVAAPDWLAAALAALRECDAQTVIAGAIARPAARGNWIALYDRRTYLRQREYAAAGGCVTANLIMHRDVFRRVGPFDTTFAEAAYEDWDWATRARALGVAVAFAKAAVVVHPCMSTAAELKGKAERLARGNVLMQRKAGRPIAVEPLPAALGRAVVRAVREPRADAVARIGLLWIGARVAVWSRRAAQDQHRALHD